MGSEEGSTVRNFIVSTVYLMCQDDLVQKIEMGRNVVRMEEGRNSFKILTGKRVGKRPIGRPRHRLEDNIRTLNK